MSGTHPTPAEHHLGDRLAALVDGELGHDARERVLAHLATCARCKSEADAQRRVKSVFAESAPPPPSAGLLARLQGLPGGADEDGGTPFGGRPGAAPGHPGDPGAAGDPSGLGLFGVRPGGFGYVSAHDRAPAPARTGFRIHEAGRPEPERSPWRGRRFAFAAASAVSFAAIALGGAMPAVTAVDARGGEGSGNNVTPLRSSPGQTGATTENTRRRAGTGPSAGAGRFAERPGGVLLPGAPVRARQPGAPPFLHATTPLIGANGLPPMDSPGFALSPSPTHLAPPAP
ncbi:zf-HC2 domain-containing protein [Streptomyces sp. TRM49041]|uniref:anti-sigma factor family protein n=1 Tax=Streptomyces sp. TRM49041 TaxID=2603216 RepID=UPI0011EDE1D5|nr:zf-HC2 domain-containing protein [Streptomyces sp. TRM49041]